MLYASQQSLKRISKQNLDLIAEINRSLNRYLVDIKRNYDDIISELNIEQYQEIMEQYSRKVNYYYDHVEKICCGDPPNVFIPLRDFEKTLCRASVESY